MVAINIREFTHNTARYLEKVQSGERIILMKRNIPIAEVTPHNPHITKPGWKREIKRIKLKGEPLSQTVIRMRREARH